VARRTVDVVIQEPGKIGLRLEAACDSERPHVSAITPGSQAAAADGLSVGMELVAVQGEAVGAGRGAAMAAIAQAGRPLRLRFQDRAT